MADLLAYLPPFEGLLPKWLFLVRSVPIRPPHSKQEKKQHTLNKKKQSENKKIK